MNNVLPIGSVVKIQGIEKPIMIFGFLQKSGIGDVEYVDYIGVPYPEGNIGPQVQIGFQRYDITEVLFEGYKTDEFIPWSELIKKYSDKRSSDQNAEE